MFCATEIRPFPLLEADRTSVGLAELANRNRIRFAANRIRPTTETHRLGHLRIVKRRRSKMDNSETSTGFVRLSGILAPRGPIPVSKSTWWAGVKSGRYPKPVKLGPRITAWRIEDIRALIEKPGA